MGSVWAEAIEVVTAINAKTKNCHKGKGKVRIVASQFIGFELLRGSSLENAYLDSLTIGIQAVGKSLIMGGYRFED